MSFVLCYNTPDVGNKAGVNFFDIDFEDFKQRNIAFLPRKLVDAGDEEGLAVGRKFKQILPYICVVRNGKNGKEVLSYSRGKVGDARMSAKRSIGFGGHVDYTDIVFYDNGDVDLEETLKFAAYRELCEELNLQYVPLKLTALWELFCIADNTDEVGSVHLGFVYVAELLDGVEVLASDECKDLQWIAVENLGDEASKNYESWSKNIMTLYSSKL